MVMEEQNVDMELASERIPVPKVQEVSESANVETTNKVSNIPRVKPRLRKKALHAAILKQMEFYFSDANLSKDRFLSNLIKQNPNVDLNVFMRFNKIRELTTDLNRITKALQNSVILSVSPDGNTVCRTTPIKIRENTEECTVYVQNLPPDSDHEWLVSLFSRYGSVAYVSIPRYKSNRKIKGFAFVEYDTPEAAQKCIKSFHKKGCVLPLYTAPESILSITTFDDLEKDVTLECQLLKSDHCNKDLNKNSEKMDETNDTSDRCMSESSKEQKENRAQANEELPAAESNAVHTKSGKKRKHNNSEAPCEVSCEESSQSENTNQKVDDNAVPIKKKKRKHSNDGTLESDINNQNESIELDNTTKSKKMKNNDHIDESSVKLENSVMELSNASAEGKQNEEDIKDNNVEAVNTTKEEEGEEDSDRKKEGKKRKRKRRNKGEDISGNMGLQVMMKRDWKHLRNKYLELQRSKMKQLKQHLKKACKNQWAAYDRNKPVKEENDLKEQAPANKTSRKFSFIPGTIVKIEMNECCTDPKSFKSELRGNSSIKYIDVSEGSYEAYVRCETPESALAFAQKSINERHMEVLQGDEERAYLDKILQDRDEKLGNKIRYKQRGRDKLLKRAEKALGKHIKFDEV